MTKERLKQYLNLAEEIAELKERIAILEARCEGGAIIITDMPRGGKRSDVQPELGDAVRKLVVLERRLDKEMADVEEYIQSIPDSTTRLIFRYKHIYGYSFEGISRKMNYCTRQVKRKYYKIYNTLPNR